MRVGCEANEAVAVAVEIGGERGQARPGLPGEGPVEAFGTVLGGARDHDQREQQHGRAGGDPTGARRSRRSGREPSGKALHDAHRQPPRQHGERQGAKARRDFALGEQQRIAEAAAAELLEQREADRIAEIGVQLILHGQRQQPEAEVHEGEADQRLPGRALTSEPRAGRPRQQRRQRLRHSVAGGEQRDLAGPVDRARSAEAAAEHAVFAVRDGELDRAQAKNR